MLSCQLKMNQVSFFEAPRFSMISLYLTDSEKHWKHEGNRLLEGGRAAIKSWLDSSGPRVIVGPPLNQHTHRRSVTSWNSCSWSKLFLPSAIIKQVSEVRRLLWSGLLLLDGDRLLSGLVNVSARTVISPSTCLRLKKGKKSNSGDATSPPTATHFITAAGRSLSACTKQFQKSLRANLRISMIFCSLLILFCRFNTDSRWCKRKRLDARLMFERLIFHKILFYSNRQYSP